MTGEQRARAEAALVAKAVDGMDARRLRQAARRMLEVISEELADADEADQLEDEEHAAEAQTWLSMHDNGDGTCSGRFTIVESLSSFLCKGRSLEVGVDPVGVGQGELFEGLFPVGDGLAFDEPAWGLAF